MLSRPSNFDSTHFLAQFLFSSLAFLTPTLGRPNAQIKTSINNQVMSTWKCILLSSWEWTDQPARHKRGMVYCYTTKKPLERTMAKCFPTPLERCGSTSPVHLALSATFYCLILKRVWPSLWIIIHFITYRVFGRSLPLSSHVFMMNFSHWQPYTMCCIAIPKEN